MKQLTLMIGVILFLTLMIQSVNAVPPVLSTIQTGSLEIIAPSYETIQKNTALDIYWHLFNTTNILTNSSATCYYHLYSKQSKGEHLITINNVKAFTNGRDFEVNLNASNFTSVGDYCHLIECNTSTQTGAIERCFEVTESGTSPTTAQSLIYALLILASMFFLLVCLYGAFTIDGKNDFTMGGDLIKVNFNKYYKGFLFLIAYLFAIFTSYLTWQVSVQFLILDLGTAVFKTIFTFLWLMFFPIMILLIIVGFMKWLTDVELHKLAERHLKQR
jgi:hypothetical protein